MNENEKPAIGTSEAAVLTVVELIARAAQMSEQHLAYWLDLYYQVRSRHEAEKGATADDCCCLLERISETLDAIRWTPTALGHVEETEDGPSRTPAPTEKPEGGRQIAAPTEADEDDVTDNNVGNKSPEAEDPTPVMRGRETIKLQERVKSESRSESMRKQKAAEREFKMRVADRLRDLRAQGLRTGDIVRISGGNVTDSAVLSILDGQFRPIADYRALDAALEKCAEEIQKGVTGT